MRLINFQTTSSSLTGTVEFDNRSERLYYEFDRASPWESADPFLVAMLLPAMHAGEPIQIEAPISRKLAASIPRIQAIASRWWPDTFRPIDVRVEALVEREPAASGACGSFFSLGVDSFYTALNSPDCTHLIYMRGVETLLDDSGACDQVEARIRRVAAEIGKQLITGRTNLRSVFPLRWAEFYHGGGLASVGHALGLPEILISSTHAVNHLFFWGSHSILDPLWSSERTRIVHFGDVSRAEKTLAIAENPIALANLRVCVVNQGGDENCGRCFKCVRTMIVLKAVDLLKYAPFPSLERPLNLPVSDVADMAFADELVDLMQRLGNPQPRLLEMVRRNLNAARRKEAVREWVRAVPRMRSAVRRLRRVRIPESPIQPIGPVPPVTIAGLEKPRVSAAVAGS